MSKNRKSIFSTAKHMARAVVATMGRHCEVVVHDFADMDHSVVHVEGNVTGRRVGAPVTDMALRLIGKFGNAVEDQLAYKASTKNGRVLKSSTTFLRDEEGEIVGCMCINFDITDYVNTHLLVGEFIHTEKPVQDLPLRDMTTKETFAASASEVLHVAVAEAVEKIGKQPATMSLEEKIHFVRILEHQGVFLLKGAVEDLALILGVSKFTIYNYLKKIRRQAAHIE